MNEKLLGILVAAAGVTETEAAELATTDEGIAELQSKVSAKLADVKKNADGRALKTTREAVEAALKAKGIENPSFATLSAHLDELESKSVASASGGKLTDEAVLKHPAVIDLKNRLSLETDTKVKAAKQEAQQELKDKVAAFEQQQTETAVRQWARQQIAELKPVFSQNAAVAANQAKDLEDKIVQAAKWKKEGDALQLYTDQGELLRDANENIVSADAKARDIITSYYELPVSQHRDAAGLTQEQINRNQSAYAGPKNQAEYDAALLATAPGEDRQKLITSYKAYQETQPKTA